MRLIQRWLISCAIVIAYFGASGCFYEQNIPITQKNIEEANQMTGKTSPSSAIHPGQISFEDRVDNRQWTKQADEVPQGIAWVNVEGVWKPVIRIEITGTVEQRRITKYGQDGEFLETTIQSPLPQPRP
jgi:hypothetical protein